MGAIAKAAGLSRQALYLTFADKADLFVALVRYVDEQVGLVGEDQIEGLARQPGRLGDGSHSDGPVRLFHQGQGGGQDAVAGGNRGA